MTLDRAIDELVNLGVRNGESLTESEKEAIDVAIANMQTWISVKEKLLLSTFRHLNDDGYARGIRYSLALIDSVIRSQFEN